MSTNDNKSNGFGMVRIVLGIVAFLLFMGIFLRYVGFIFILPIILFLPVLAVQTIRDHYMEKKAYRESAYYEKFRKEFNSSIIHSPAYRLYNGAAVRNLPVRFPINPDDRAEGLSYFFYEDTMYLIPNFRWMRLSEDGRAVWQVNRGDVWTDFGGIYDTMREKALYPGQTVRFLVERRMIIEYDLTKTPPPSCIHVIHSYETAFCDDASAFTIRPPQSIADLYDMMRAIPDLCGEYTLTEDGKSIRWRIRQDIQITLSIHAHYGRISVERVRFGKVQGKIAGSISTVFELYDEVCKIGLRGHVLVLRAGIASDAVLYSGRKEDCPYKAEKKALFGKYYYIEMR